MTDPLLATSCGNNPLSRGKVLVVNGDFHGRCFLDMYGNKVEPGQMAWLNRAHADALNNRNRFWKIVENSI